MSRLLSAMARDEARTGSCGDDICYRGPVTEAGATGLRLAAAEGRDGPTLRIHSGGGGIGAAATIVRTAKARHMDPSVIRDPTEQTDCASACVAIVAVGRAKRVDPDTRLTVHMTRLETFAPGPMLQLAVGACERYLADDCQEQVNLRLYGLAHPRREWRHQQSLYLRVLEGDGPHEMSRQVEECRGPEPLETLAGITFTWRQFEAVTRGEEHVECPKPKQGR